MVRTMENCRVNISLLKKTLRSLEADEVFAGSLLIPIRKALRREFQESVETSDVIQIQPARVNSDNAVEEVI